MSRLGAWLLIAILAFAACASATWTAGCSAPGLLITPVATRKTLTETEVWRDGCMTWPKIALIDVSGVLLNSHRQQLLEEGEHPVSLLREQLEKARRDRAVKAVLLRINSPGGTVVASELMHDEITRFKKCGKPVIAVLMDVAASGGYYIACACDEILAQPSTITGSIGVMMLTFDISGTMDMIGVKTDAIISGDRKDSGSMFRPMRPEERGQFQTVIDEMHERFVAVVARGRPGLDQAAVRKLADGRVYTAGQALEAGLIDRIAKMGEAIDSAKARTGSKQVRVVRYHRPLDYRPTYYARAARTPGGDVNLINLELPDLLTGLSPQFLYLWTR